VEATSSTGGESAEETRDGRHGTLPPKRARRGSSPLPLVVTAPGMVRDCVVGSYGRPLRQSELVRPRQIVGPPGGVDPQQISDPAQDRPVDGDGFFLQGSEPAGGPHRPDRGRGRGGEHIPDETSLEACIQHQQGRCRRGEDCRFSHIEHRGNAGDREDRTPNLEPPRASRGRGRGGGRWKHNAWLTLTLFLGILNPGDTLSLKTRFMVTGVTLEGNVAKKPRGKAVRKQWEADNPGGSSRTPEDGHPAPMTEITERAARRGVERVMLQEREQASQPMGRSPPSPALASGNAPVPDLQ
jgi:hypothetical protein